MNGVEDSRLITKHRLLPHERWLAAALLERQRHNRAPIDIRNEQNYGTEGIALGAAGVATVFPGSFIGIVGLALLIVADGRAPLATISYSLMIVGIVLISAGSIRLIQGIRAGRAHRGGRPFIK